MAVSIPNVATHKYCVRQKIACNIFKAEYTG